MKLLSAQEVAKLLGCAESTIRTNAAKDRLGFRTVKVGSLWKFPDEEVYQHLYGSNWREIVKEQGLFDEDTSNASSGTEQI